jgi:hypothetical protein
MSLANVWQGAAEVRRRFGAPAAALHLLHHVVNRFVFFDCLEVIVLERRDLRPLPAEQQARFSSRLATRDDLVQLHAQPGWDIGSDKLRAFDQGDQCVLSLIEGRIAGYTWVHALGRPELIAGLQLRLPDRYLYNYAGYTAPEFRGAGLQSMRHHSVLEQPDWRERHGLVGYVRWINYPSKKGQGRSGYRKVGSIWLLGSHRRYAAWFTPALQRLGIARLQPRPGQTTPDEAPAKV